VDANGTVECAHCEAKGTCLVSKRESSCDECRSAASARLDKSDFQQLELVSCSKCNGAGRQNLRIDQSSILLREEEEEAEATRRINFHRYVVALVAIGAGLLIAGAGLYAETKLDFWDVNDNENYLIGTLPVASAIISGALGAVVGGPHLTSTRRRPGTERRSSTPQSQAGSQPPT
jgi:hypothetical protein